MRYCACACTYVCMKSRHQLAQLDANLLAFIYLLFVFGFTKEFSVKML